MKRILALAMLLLMLVSVAVVFASCGGDENKTSPSENASASQETNGKNTGVSGNTTAKETREPLEIGDSASPDEMGWDDGEEGTL